jgi:hypothetical protein
MFSQKAYVKGHRVEDQARQGHAIDLIPQRPSYSDAPMLRNPITAINTSEGELRKIMLGTDVVQQISCKSFPLQVCLPD